MCKEKVIVTIVVEIRCTDPAMYSLVAHDILNDCVKSSSIVNDDFQFDFFQVQDERLRDVNLARVHRLFKKWLDMLASSDYRENSKEARKQKCNSTKCKSQGNRNDTSLSSSKCSDYRSYYNYYRKSRKRYLKSHRTENLIVESPTSHKSYPSFLKDNLNEFLDSLIFDSTIDNNLQFSFFEKTKPTLDSNYMNIKSKVNVTNKSDKMIFAYSSIEALDDAEETNSRPVKIKGAKQKQLGTDDQDSDTKKYGKSPKFDDKLDNASFFNAGRSRQLTQNPPKVTMFGSTDSQNWKNQDIYTEDNSNSENNYDGIVFNTLEGFVPKSSTSDNSYFFDQPGPSDKKPHKNQSIFSNNCINDQNICMSNNNIPMTQEFISENISEKFNFENGYPIGEKEYLQGEDMSMKNDKMLEKVEFTPGDVGRMLNMGNALDFPRTQSTDDLKLVKMHLPIILRLTVNCPFKNVRVKCIEILQIMKEQELSIPIPIYNGPSAFIPSSEPLRTLMSSIDCHDS
ncbi:hypothetical protein KQX54_018844 [Cotesia glomerata]|uniref:Uncharacterized protein n=1 Tax=Cotesia glomerata TaxID=32391 RepID=A0AAV7J7T4_COTGL|nr:hypothetical protein KQX54_018844 [Cotesia glomerata]